MKANRKAVLLAAAWAALALPVAAQAGGWPARPIKVVVPYNAGGGLDMMCRTVSDRLSQLLKQPVVVENRAGASGTIGSGFVAKASPDGYTILCANNSETTLAQFILPKLPYSPDRDLAPLTMAVKQTVALVGTSALPAANARELVEQSRRKPIAYANPGTGSNTTLAMEMFNAAAKADFTSIPFTGVALAEVLGGQVPLTVLNLAPLLPYIRAGKLRPYVVFQHERHPALPDVPTAKEVAGVDVIAASWFGFFAPAETPAPIRKHLEDSLRQSLADPAVAGKLAQAEMQVVGMPSAEFAKVIAAERAYHQDLVKRFNATPR